MAGMWYVPRRRTLRTLRRDRGGSPIASRDGPRYHGSRGLSATLVLFRPTLNAYGGRATTSAAARRGSHRVVGPGAGSRSRGPVPRRALAGLRQGRGLQGRPGPLAEVGRLGVKGKTPCEGCSCIKPPRCPNCSPGSRKRRGAEQTRLSRHASRRERIAMNCPRCGKPMTRLDQYWFCGADTPPVSIRVGESFPETAAATLAGLENLPSLIALPLREYLEECAPRQCALIGCATPPRSSHGSAASCARRGLPDRQGQEPFPDAREVGAGRTSGRRHSASGRTSSWPP